MPEKGIGNVYFGTFGAEMTSDLTPAPKNKRSHAGVYHAVLGTRGRATYCSTSAGRFPDGSLNPEYSDVVHAPFVGGSCTASGFGSAVMCTMGMPGCRYSFALPIECLRPANERRGNQIQT